MTSASKASALPADVLEAHAAWLARGKTGDGRLVVRDTTLTGSLEGTDLRHAEFERVGCVGVSFANANLDRARFAFVALERADLRRSSLTEARFADCDLRRTALAGARIDKTGFLRCAFGDFGSQPIGKPDVRAAYAIVAPDLSHDADASRIGHAGEVDARWYTAQAGGPTRRFVFTSDGERRFVALVLHMHVQWSREATPRFLDRVVFQGFSSFLADGAPEPFRDALPPNVEAAIRETVAALAAQVSQDTTDSAGIE